MKTRLWKREIPVKQKAGCKMSVQKDRWRSHGTRRGREMSGVAVVILEAVKKNTTGNTQSSGSYPIVPTGPGLLSQVLAVSAPMRITDIEKLCRTLETTLSETRFLPRKWPLRKTWNSQLREVITYYRGPIISFKGKDQNGEILEQEAFVTAMVASVNQLE